MREAAGRLVAARAAAAGTRCVFVRAAVLAALLAPGCDVPTAPPRFENTLVVQGPTVQLPVLGVAAQSPPAEVDFTGVDADFAVRARRGELQLTPVPDGGTVAGTGTLEVTIATDDGAVAVTQPITIDAAGTPQVVVLDEAQIQALLTRTVTITLTGALGPAQQPIRYVTVQTLVRLTTEFGGEA